MTPLEEATVVNAAPDCPAPCPSPPPLWFLADKNRQLRDAPLENACLHCRSGVLSAKSATFWRTCPAFRGLQGIPAPHFLSGSLITQMIRKRGQAPLECWSFSQQTVVSSPPSAQEAVRSTKKWGPWSAKQCGPSWERAPTFIRTP